MTYLVSLPYYCGYNGRMCLAWSSMGRSDNRDNRKILLPSRPGEFVRSQGRMGDTVSCEDVNRTIAQIELTLIL